VAQFFVVVLASLVIGVAVGMVASFITRFSAHVHGEFVCVVSVYVCVVSVYVCVVSLCVCP